jgi:hypothetical protein
LAYIDLFVLRSRLTNVDDPALDDVLQVSADWAKDFIDTYTHRTFESFRQTRYFGPDALDTSPLPFTSRGGLDYSDPLARRVVAAQIPYRRLYLDQDLLTIYSVTNGDGSTIPSSGYYAEPRNESPHYSIWLKSDYSWTWDTDGWVAVDADWGYSATASPIIKGCAYQLAEYHWRSQVPSTKRQPLWMDIAKGSQLPEGFPTDVMKALDPFVRLAR